MTLEENASNLSAFLSSNKSIVTVFDAQRRNKDFALDFFRFYRLILYFLGSDSALGNIKIFVRCLLYTPKVIDGMIHL